jgi:ATP-dependent Clp protease protease subunit
MGVKKTKSDLPVVLAREPAIRLYGAVDDALLGRFLEQLKVVRGQREPVVVELSTSGGDADVARRMAEEIRLCRELGGMDLYVVGKAMVYSAGVMIMAAFPVHKRYLSRDTVLLIHEWQIEKEIRFTGALRVCVGGAQDFLAELEIARQMERQTFTDLVRGTQLSLTQLSAQLAKADWYLLADEAVQLELVAGLL